VVGIWGTLYPSGVEEEREGCGLVAEFWKQHQRATSLYMWQIVA